MGQLWYLLYEKYVLAEAINQTIFLSADGSIVKLLITFSIQYVSNTACYW